MATNTPKLGLVNPEKGKGEKYNLELWTENNNKIDQFAEEASAQLAEIASRANIKNEITNGDFSQGLTGWAGSSVSGLQVVDGICEFIALSSSGFVSANPISIPAESQYYARALVKADTTSVRLYSTNLQTGGVTVYHNGNGQYQFLSAIYLNPVTSNVYARIGDARSSGWTKVQFDKFMLIDLTKAFGKGNEPTKAEMDKIVDMVPEQWWGGELGPDQKKYVGYLLKTLRDKADLTTTYTKAQVDASMLNKVDKVAGKGLSTNDYTAIDKNKVNNLPSNTLEMLTNSNDRIDNLLATPVPVGSVIAEEIIDARDGASNLGNKVRGIDQRLEEIANTPKVSMSFLNARQGFKNAMWSGTGFYTFGGFYQVFDVTYNTSGVLYAYETALSGRTSLQVFRSLDGGETWIAIGSIPCNVDAGERIRALYVDPTEETFYILKLANNVATTKQYNVISYSNNGSTFTQIGNLDIGNRYWHAASHNIDSKNYDGQWTTMFAEYAGMDAAACKVWKTTDRGATWTEVFSKTSQLSTAEIRHFHVLQFDPYSNDIWIGSGDTDPQCHIWKSSDGGSTWTEMGGGSQEFRTLTFVIEKDKIFFATDSPHKEIPSKLYECDKSFNNIRLIGEVAYGHAVYSLCRTYFPRGFLIFQYYEGVASEPSDRIKIQFYDYEDDKIKDVGQLYTSGIPVTEYIGFVESARYQCKNTGVITAMLSANLADKYSCNTNTAIAGNIVQLKLTV